MRKMKSCENQKELEPNICVWIVQTKHLLGELENFEM